MNPIVIEQSPDDVRLAFEVHNNAAIQRIRLARAKVASQAIDETPKAPIVVNFSFKSKPLQSPRNIMRLEIAFRMAGVEERGESDHTRRKPEPVVLVECAYEVDYEVLDGFEPSAGHIKAFKDGNAIFNAWPYFREYLQNNLQRMGLPPLVAPFLRLQPRAKPAEPRQNAPRAARKVPASKPPFSVQ